MTYYEIRFAWNAQADDDNRWHSLSVPEKIEWAAIHAAAKERAARHAAQAEVVALKERIARAGVEQRRAVREAVLAEREECAKVCDELVSANACACQIRARGEPEQPALPYHPAMMSEIINMADEIAICFSADSKEFDHDGLLRFAAMVQANEREACAQVCESQAGTASMFASSRDAKTHAAAAKSFAAAIRARQ